MSTISSPPAVTVRSTLLLALVFSLHANAQITPVTRYGDTGYFQDTIKSATADPQIMLVPPNGSPDTEICSYSPTGAKAPPLGGSIGKDCFRFQADPSNPNPGYMVIAIHDAGHFYNLGPDQFDAPKRSAYAHAWQYTELKTAWYLSPAQQNNVASFSERRNCTISPPTHNTVHGLIDAWPSGCDNLYDTRSQSCGFLTWRPWRQNPSSLLTSIETSRSRDPATNDPWGVCGPTTQTTCGTIPDYDINNNLILCTDQKREKPVDTTCKKNPLSWSPWSPPLPLSPGQTAVRTATQTYQQGPPLCPDHTVTETQTSAQRGTWEEYDLSGGDCIGNDVIPLSCTTDQSPRNFCAFERGGKYLLWEYICVPKRTQLN